MATDRWLAIISDLHISEGKLDDCDDELEGHLVTFLDWLGNHAEPAELIINGDFLDFVQASPWSGPDLEGQTVEGIPLCFDEEQSVQKFAAIERAHPKTFAALKRFLAKRKENRLVILPGNHDPDFFWVEVQRQFSAAVGQALASEQLHFCFERAYRPAGASWLWIEHGHQYDPVNKFFVAGEERWNAKHPPIFKASDGTRRLYDECTGTRFMIRYLNGLDERYPYVDNVKPFSRFIRIFGASALVPGWGPLEAAVAVTKMIAYLTGTAVTRSDDLLGVAAEDGTVLPHAVIAWIHNASDAERKRVAEALRQRGFELPFPLEMVLERADDLARLFDFLDAHPDIIQGLGEKDPALLGKNPGTLTLKKGFKANETEDLYQGAEAVARDGVTTVVMGHTHEPIERLKPFTYFNTGSWTRYYRFADKEPTLSWRVLREQSYERFPYRLRYGLVQPRNSFATIETWRERSKA